MPYFFCEETHLLCNFLVAAKMYCNNRWLSISLLFYHATLSIFCRVRELNFKRVLQRRKTVLISLFNKLGFLKRIMAMQKSSVPLFSFGLDSLPQFNLHILERQISNWAAGKRGGNSIRPTREREKSS